MKPGKKNKNIFDLQKTYHLKLPLWETKENDAWGGGDNIFWPIIVSLNPAI